MIQGMTTTESKIVCTEGIWYLKQTFHTVCIQSSLLDAMKSDVKWQLSRRVLNTWNNHHKNNTKQLDLPHRFGVGLDDHREDIGVSIRIRHVDVKRGIPIDTRFAYTIRVLMKQGADDALVAVGMSHGEVKGKHLLLIITFRDLRTSQENFLNSFSIYIFFTHKGHGDHVAKSCESPKQC